MIRFLLHALLAAGTLPPFLRWSGDQVERQIDRMQAQAFNTPGVGSPIAPPVVIGALVLLAGQWWLGRRVLRLAWWQAVLSLLLGGGAGGAIFTLQRQSRP